MKPTDQLKEEHKAIRVMLNVLGKMCQKLEAGEQVSPEHLEQALDFFKGFADKCHHFKEENLLFPAMEAVGFTKDAGPIYVMLLEHASGRNHIKQMSEGIAQYKFDVQQSIPTIVEAAKGYIQLLTAHIDKEDNILFPMADSRLLESKQGELEKEFDRVESEVIGVGKHEEYHQMIKNLGAIYLE